MNPSELDLPLLRALSTRGNFDKYFNYVDTKALADETCIILNDFEDYYDMFPEMKEVEWVEFSDWFFNKQHKNLVGTQQKLYKELFSRITKAQKKEISFLLKKLKEEKALDELLSNINSDVVIDKLRETLSKFEEEIPQTEDHLKFDLVEICKQTDRANGLRWRLTGLQNSIGGLIKGDLIVVAAYVETGKTMFISSEGSYMASQLEDDRKVLWFNNEGTRENLALRILCSALGRPEELIRKNLDKATEYYTKILHGNIDRIQIYDAAGQSYKYIEQKCKNCNPGLIIVDQLDYVSGFDKDNDVIKNRKLYGWAGDISAKYAPFLAVSQASGAAAYIDKNTGEEEYIKYLGMHQLNFSKVEKQGKAQAIILIGKDKSYPNLRFISVPKNKIGKQHVKFECKFDQPRCRYED